jgi:hypothetical protein
MSSIQRDDSEGLLKRKDVAVKEARSKAAA